jgi:MYXO-CTERM domain-containing protein
MRRACVVALAAGSVVALVPAARAQTPIKVACVGASTTSGDGSSPGHHYPDELQRLLGAGYVVTNFGVSGTTMLKATTTPYWTTSAFTQALASDPQIAIIWFGGNDAKPENWTAHKGEFLGDYEDMVRQFQALPSHPRTFVVLSLLVHDTEGIPKVVVDDEVIPLVRQAAAETGSGIIDVHDDLADHPEYFPDGIHPDDDGTIAVAKLAYAALTAPASVDGAAPPDVVSDASAADAPGARGADADGSGATDAASSTDAGSIGAAGASGAGGSTSGPAGASGGIVDGAAPGTAGAGTGATSTGGKGGGCSLSPSESGAAGSVLAGAAMGVGLLVRTRRRRSR